MAFKKMLENVTDSDDAVLKFGALHRPLPYVLETQVLSFLSPDLLDLFSVSHAMTRRMARFFQGTHSLHYFDTWARHPWGRFALKVAVKFSRNLRYISGFDKTVIAEVSELLRNNKASIRIADIPSALVDPAVMDLVCSCPQLERLDLQINNYQALTDVVMRHVASSSSLTNIRWLSLHSMRSARLWSASGPAGLYFSEDKIAQILMRARGWPLAYLCMGIDTATLPCLAAPSFRTLHELVLQLDIMNEKMAADMAAVLGQLSTLQTLSIHGTSTYCWFLSTVQWKLSQVTTLRLCSVPLLPTIVAPMLETLYLRIMPLAHLNEELPKMLSPCDRLQCIESTFRPLPEHLAHAHYSAQPMATALRNGSWPRLQQFKWMAEADVSAEIAVALAIHPRSDLRVLECSVVEQNDVAMLLLTNTGLKQLECRQPVRTRHAPAQHLADEETWQLQRKYAAAISDARPLTGIQSLSLAIADQKLFTPSRFPNLTRLELCGEEVKSLSLDDVFGACPELEELVLSHVDVKALVGAAGFFHSKAPSVKSSLRLLDIAIGRNSHGHQNCSAVALVRVLSNCPALQQFILRYQTDYDIISTLRSLHAQITSAPMPDRIMQRVSRFVLGSMYPKLVLEREISALSTLIACLPALRTVHVPVDELKRVHELQRAHPGILITYGSFTDTMQ